MCRQITNLKSDVLVILPLLKPCCSRLSMTDCKTDSQSMLFLYASPHICSHWQGTELCFALLWLLNSGIFSKWSLVVCLEELYMKNTKKWQWKEQDVNADPAAQLRKHTHRLYSFIPLSCCNSLALRITTTTSQVWQYRSSNKTRRDIFTALYFLTHYLSEEHLEQNNCSILFR